MRKFFRLIVIFLSCLVTGLSLLSLIHDLSYWYFKILDFPRLQYFILAVVCLILFLLINKKWNWLSFLVTGGLAVSILIQGVKIGPYWFGEKTVPDAAGAEEEKINSVKVMVANILIDNDNYSEFLDLVEKTDPDLLLVMEVDQEWIDNLENIQEDYPFSMEHPLKNAYGMALYSKFPLQNKEKKFFQHEDVPSFHTKVMLPGEKEIFFHGVHPVAPIPSKKYPDNVNRKEVALSKTADMIKQENIPSLVAGDFNDVSWSHTSRMFENSGNLKNIRIGRGLYNSFDATSPILRWPLDHFFVTEGFSVFNLERLPKFGSDHFAMMAEFNIE